jgi:hypothetical protein
MLRAPILEAKVVDHILKQSKNDPEEITVEDFKKLFDKV